MRGRGRKPGFARFLAAFFAAIATAFATASCTQNLFSTFGGSTTDAALLFEAQIQMSERQWSAAIADFQAMSAAGLAQRATQDAYASAYAGRCGLDLVALVNYLDAQQTSNFFPVLLTSFKGAKASQVSDCQTAESILLGVGSTGAVRTPDENTLMVFTAIADMGVNIAAGSDPQGTGAIAAGWDSCTSSAFGPAAAPPGAATDLASREVAVDINLVVDSISGPGMPQLLSTLSSSLTTMCTTVAGIAPTYAFCGQSPATTSATAFTALQIKAVEGILRTSDYPGLAVAGAGSLPGAICP